MAPNRLPAAFGWALACAALWLVGSAAASHLRVGFKEYDDEGYVAFSVRQYSGGAALYTDVFTQYGPFPFAAAEVVLSLTGMEVETDSVRLVTWVCLLATCAASAMLAWRLAPFWWVPALAAACAFPLLDSTIAEPFHPGHAIALVLACGALACLILLQHGWTRMAWLVAGLAGACLLLTKINVGVLWLLGVGTVLVLGLDLARGIRVAWCLGALASTAALASARIEHGAVALFVIVQTLGVASLLGTLAGQVKPGCVRWADVAWNAVGWSVGIGLLVVVTLARGTTPHDLLHGVVLAPLGQVGAWVFDIRWSAWVVVPAVLGTWGVVSAVRFPMSDALHAVARVVAATVFVATAVLGDAFTFWQAGACAAWLLLPRQAGVGPCLVAAIAQFQVAHAYPVAGSQLSWAVLLLLPLALAGLGTAPAVLRDRFAVASRVLGVGIPGVLLLTVAAVLADARASNAFLEGVGREPVFPGARSLRLSPVVHARWDIAVRNTRDGDVLFSVPGIASLNLWTGVPPPARWHATQWTSLLSAGQQQEIVDGVRAARDPRIAVHTGLLAYMASQGFMPRGPAVRALIEETRPYARFLEIELRGRAADVPVYQLLRPDGVGWTLNVPPGRLGVLTAIRLLGEPWYAPEVLIAVRAGSPLDVERDGVWTSAVLPVDTSGGARLRIPFAILPEVIDGEGRFLEMTGAAGEVVPAAFDELSSPGPIGP